MAVIKKVAYIGGTGDRQVSQGKFSGYKRAMREYNIDIQNEYLSEGYYIIGTGWRATRSFMMLPNPPTAIVCASDTIAVGCIKYLSQNGFSIPQDVAVVGYDNIPLSYIIEPPLTTVTIPIDAMAREAMAMTIGAINSGTARKRQVVLNTTLCIRRTTVKDSAFKIEL